MKSSRRIILGVFCVTVAACLVVATPRPQEAAPSDFKVLLENESGARARLSQQSWREGLDALPPGVCLLADFRQRQKRIHFSGWRDDRTGARAGQATWHEAETHSSEASSAAHALLVELKK